MTRKRSPGSGASLFLDPTHPGVKTSPRMTDHDSATRHQAVDLAASVRVSGDELRAQGCWVRSLSLGGAYIEIEPLPVGTLINLTFSMPGIDERLSLDAIVQWGSDGGINVLFDSLRASEVWVLWRFLSVASCENELEPTQRLSTSSLTPPV
jgi:hypothetical protein